MNTQGRIPPLFETQEMQKRPKKNVGSKELNDCVNYYAKMSWGLRQGWMLKRKRRHAVKTSVT